MQGNAVEQLGFVRRHQLRQAQNLLLLGIVIRNGSLGLLGHGLQHGHALQLHAHVFQRGCG
ncbi:hypothetical protein D3C72_1169060 [compost metagenome]